MGAKLYHAQVSFEIDVIVAAESEPDDDDFERAAKDDMDENPHVHSGFVGTATLIDTQEKLPEDWRKAIPYGDEHDGNLTCQQILDDYVPDQEPLGEQLEIAPEDGSEEQ